MIKLKDEGFGPLRGLRVLDLGTLIAGPFGASLLADFGATVIKVEKPDTGDTIRQYGNPTLDGSSLAWSDFARNKYCITVDMRKKDGQNLIKELVKETDILIENFSPGTLESWNLGYEQLSKINPRLIMVRVSGFGQTGPYADKPGLDRIALGYSGLMYITGHPNGPPVKMGISIADYLTAIFNALSAIMAVYYRDVVGTGKGQMIDLALYEAPLRITEDIISTFGLKGEIRERIGNKHLSLAPAEAYKAKDGKWILIHAALDNAFVNLAKAMEQLELIKDERFLNTRARAKHADIINGIVRQWVKKHPSVKIIQKLEDLRVPVSPINNIEDIFYDPHVKERENILNVKDPNIGNIQLPGIVPKFSLTPGEVRWTGKPIGEDNDEVFLDILKLDKDKYEKLKQIKVI